MSFDKVILKKKCLNCNGSGEVETLSPESKKFFRDVAGPLIEKYRCLPEWTIQLYSNLGGDYKRLA